MGASGDEGFATTSATAGTVRVIKHSGGVSAASGKVG